MANYFNALDDEHLALLPQELQNSDRVEEVAARVEAEVLKHYEVWSYTKLVTHWVDLGDYYWMALRGYAVDADDCTDARFKEALKHTIADVIAWRLQQDPENALLTSVSTGIGTSKSFREDANSPFPSRWTWRMANHDVRIRSFLA